MFGSDETTLMNLAALSLFALMYVVVLFVRGVRKAARGAARNAPPSKKELRNTPANLESSSPSLGRARGPDEKFCQECGAVIRAKAEICPKCGVRQPGTAYKVQFEKNRIVAGWL